jgi:protein TonB
MKQLLLGLLFLTAAFAGQAQQITHPVYPYRETKYFDSTNVELPTPVGSAYWLQATYSDSVSGVVRRCYPSGKLKEYIPYADLQRRIIHGTVSTWDENGQMRTKEEYIGGYRHGQLFTYYSDGTLQRHDTYRFGRSLVGACFGPDGRAVPYSAYEQLPLYPGGEAMLVKEVRRRISILPADAWQFRYYRESNSEGFIGGEMKVAFTVATDGTVKDVTIDKSSMQPSINNQVLTAVRSMSKRFLPGRRNGRPMEARMELPLSFELLPNIYLLPRL